MSNRLTRAAVAVVLCAGGAALVAEERIDYAALVRIRKEAREHSQIMRTLHFLTDVHGPRLTGSPGYKAAAEWALGQMRSWGLENAHLEPWEFGHAGWTTERFAGYIVSPVKDSLVGEVVAWTPGTNGPVRAHAVRIEPPRCVPASPAPPAPPAAPAAPAAPAPPAAPAAPAPPAPAAARAPAPAAAPVPAAAGPGAQAQEKCPTAEELNAYLNGVKEKVKGAIVLVGAATKVPVTFSPAPLRRDEEQLRRQYDPDNPAPQPFGDGPEPQRDPTRLTANKINELVDQFLVANGAIARVNDAGREMGQVRAFQNRTYDVTKAVPSVVLRNEDYGRISRLLDDGTRVELELAITNQVHPDGTTSYNAVAEIPGTDKRAEVVMLGAHLDSWHSATGATDNAVNAAVMMEAVRILKTLGLKPRRTIRVALWGGEEQGLLGSQAYVKEHFGTFESPKPEYASFDGYFNVDSGTGRIRGAGIFGPKEAGTALREILLPFEDLGVVGVTTTRRRRTGGTDSTSFNAAGLPGIGLGQDPIQYFTHTWHTNLDTYERVVEEDTIREAIVVAGAVYHVAMRDEMLPRFAKEQMPAPPPPSPAPE
jgi:carboxypeptidase Q